MVRGCPGCRRGRKSARTARGAGHCACRVTDRQHIRSGGQDQRTRSYAPLRDDACPFPPVAARASRGIVARRGRQMQPSAAGGTVSTPVERRPDNGAKDGGHDDLRRTGSAGGAIPLLSDPSTRQRAPAGPDQPAYHSAPLVDQEQVPYVRIHIHCAPIVAAPMPHRNTLCPRFPPPPSSAPALRARDEMHFLR